VVGRRAIQEARRGIGEGLCVALAPPRPLTRKRLGEINPQVFQKCFQGIIYSIRCLDRHNVGGGQEAFDVMRVMIDGYCSMR
jgi:hypothetical protein